MEFNIDDLNGTDETMKKEITEYLREIIRSTYKVSDFGLVERTHEDKAWKDKIDTQGEMDSQAIINEYIEVVNA